METDNQTHLTLTYVKSSNLPTLKKTSKLRPRMRNLYSVLLIDGSGKIQEHKLDLSDNKFEGAPLNLASMLKTSESLQAKLYAEGSKYDILLAEVTTGLHSFVGKSEIELSLIPANPKDTYKPTLTFTVATSDRFNTIQSDVALIAESLEINTIDKSFKHVKRLVQVATAVAEEFDIFIKRNECILQLVDEIEQASMLVADWDNIAFDGHHPNQGKVVQYLIPVLYRCLYFVWALSKSSLGKRLSDNSIKDISAHRNQLAALINRLKSNQELDTQAVMFEMSCKVADLHNDNVINKLPASKGAGPGSSKACLPGTRVALLSRIHDWALDPTSQQLLLLHGAAGKGKSAIAHSLSKELHSEGLVVVPFFAFNRSVQACSASQLFPTWAKYLAERSPKYLEYLHSLSSLQLETLDIVDQQDNLLSKGLASLHGQPVVFIIDALDECPHEQQAQLLDLLHGLLLLPGLSCFARFFFTYRTDQVIAQKFNDLSALNLDIDNEEATVDDIYKFVNFQLQGISGIAHLVNDVTQAAETLFLCAAVICHELMHIKRLTSDRRQFIQKIKATPGMSLYQTYKAILEMHFTETTVELFCQVMTWVFLVQSPQPRNVFEVFAKVLYSKEEQVDVKEILSHLGSLLSGTGPQDTMPISPLHTSLRDFLLTPAASGQFFVDLNTESQKQIAWACLRIMNDPNDGLCFNICKLPAFALNSEVEDLHNKVAEHISLGLQYACVAIGYHLRHSRQESGISTLHDVHSMDTVKPALDIEKELMCFIHERFLYWLEAHSCMRTKENAPGAILPHLYEWAQLNRNLELKMDLQDFMKFEKRFRKGYQESVLQIYFSGLLFSPQASRIIKHYGPSYQLPVSIIDDAELRWPALEPLVIQTSSSIGTATFSPDSTKMVSGSSDKTVRVWDTVTGQQLGEALRGHEHMVNSVAFSSDGTKIVSGSGDKTVRVWDTETGQQLGEALQGHEDEVASVAFSPDGTKIVSGSRDDTVRVWNTVTGQQLGEALQGHEAWVTSVAFSSDGIKIVSGSWDKTIRVWDTTTGQQLGEALQGHGCVVTSVAFSPDGTKIVSGSSDNTARVWDTGTGQQLGEALQGHVNYVTSVAFSPDGTKIVSGSGDKTVRVWDTTTGQQLGEALQGHKDYVNSVAFSPDGTKIVSGSQDNTVRVWDTATEQQLGDALQGHEHNVNSVTFSPDGTKIVSGSGDKTVRVWDTTTGQQLGEPLQGHEDEVASVAFSPDGTKIVSGSEDKTVRVWDIATGQQLGEALKGHENHVFSVAFSPDGTKIVSGSWDKTVRVWDTRTGQQLGEALQGHEGYVISVAFSPDGTKIVSGSQDKIVRVWDTTTGQQLGEALQGHENYVFSVAFSPDGIKIVSGSWDKTIRVWDTRIGQQLGEALQGHEDYVHSVAFSPDGTKIVSGSQDNTVRVWDTETGQQLGEALQGHVNYVTSVAFSPDGTKIVSGSGDKTVRVWDTGTGQQLGEALKSHECEVNSVVFLPDGEKIVLGSSGSTVRVWDTAAGEQSGGALQGHWSHVTSIAFSPDDTDIMSGSKNHTLRVWDTTTGQHLEKAVQGDEDTSLLRFRKEHLVQIATESKSDIQSVF
ncbi:hypothetical protein DXG01_011586 [Tephrocybe rancida]|nr:hypothetical protein DXG01_011586 [Tephrocybe rancida]